MAVLWDIASCTLVDTPETSVDICQTTWHNIPQDSHLHIRRHDNLEPQQRIIFKVL
jgi:hypothetical protein